MNPATREWVAYVEADYATALVMRRSRKTHSRQIVCFHLQQCLEKYLKARLLEAGVEFTKTHDLEGLLDLAVPIEPLWAAHRHALSSITDHAVLSRYPGHPVTAREVKDLIQVADAIRKLIRSSLGLR